MPWEPPPHPPELAEDEVHVWRSVLDLRPAALKRALATLSADERRRAARFRFPVHRDRFVAAHCMLRSILGDYLGLSPGYVPLGVRPSGKPMVVSRSRGHEIEFNLSHSGDVVLVAVARGRAVGVDLERMRRGVPLERLAVRFFNRSEAVALRRLPHAVRPAAFFACWTRKEAFLKASGHGLERGLPLALGGFTVSVAPWGLPASPILPGRPEEAGRWWLINLDVAAGYAGALAVEGRARPRLFEWVAQCDEAEIREH